MQTGTSRKMESQIVRDWRANTGTGAQELLPGLGEAKASFYFSRENSWSEKLQINSVRFQACTDNRTSVGRMAAERSHHPHSIFEREHILLVGSGFCSLFSSRDKAVDRKMTRPSLHNIRRSFLEANEGVISARRHFRQCFRSTPYLPLRR